MSKEQTKHSNFDEIKQVTLESDKSANMSTEETARMLTEIYDFIDSIASRYATLEDGEILE